MEMERKRHWWLAAGRPLVQWYDGWTGDVYSVVPLPRPGIDPPVIPRPQYSGLRATP